ncbi:MAG: hypothetical protein AAFU73_06630 [Planctomycetota bacterium]
MLLATLLTTLPLAPVPRLAIGAEDEPLRAWSAVLQPGRRSVVYVDLEGDLHRVDERLGTELGFGQGHGEAIEYRLRVDAFNDFVMLRTTRTLTLHDADTLKQLARIEAEAPSDPTERHYSWSWGRVWPSPNGETIARTVGHEGLELIRLSRRGSGFEFATQTLADGERIEDVAFSPDGTRMCVVQGRHAHLYDVGTAAQQRRFRAEGELEDVKPLGGNPGVVVSTARAYSAALFLDDGRLVLGEGAHHALDRAELHVFDVETGQRLDAFPFGQPGLGTERVSSLRYLEPACLLVGSVPARGTIVAYAVGDGLDLDWTFQWERKVGFAGLPQVVWIAPGTPGALAFFAGAGGLRRYSVGWIGLERGRVEKETVEGDVRLLGLTSKGHLITLQDRVLRTSVND